MHRIDGAGHVNHLFVAEDPATLRPPTEITPEIMNAFQEELATFIEWAGIALAKGDNTQLKQALLAKFAGLDVAATKAGVQGQTYTAFTTTGATGAFVLTPNPAIGAYAAGQRFRIKFHAAGNGADAINISTLGNKNIKQYDLSGAKSAPVITAGMLADVEYDGVDFVLLNRIPDNHGIQLFTASGNFTVPMGVNVVYVTLVGGGGGGAGTISSAPYVGGGGGGGEVKYRKAVAVTPGQVIAITIGAGGAGGIGGTAGGTYANTNGSAGGASSFGALLTASGGGGGRCQAGDSRGGLGGGELSGKGADGDTYSVANLGGYGGGNMFAAPTPGDYNGSGVGNAYGGGGSGGRGSGYLQNGWTGAAGACIVEW